MRILYAIQGTGNGHLSRAMEIVPILKEMADIEVLVSGSQHDLTLPFAVHHQLKGVSFVFGKKGGIDYWETFKLLNSRKFLSEIKSLDVSVYDLVISDFEPISAWACKLAGKTCVALSNQVAVLHAEAPQPRKKDFAGNMILKNFAPASIEYGFHFKALDQHIYTPIIRKEVREMNISNQGHHTVYLPAYGEKKILKQLKKLDHTRWEVFVKGLKKEYTVNHITFFPISSRKFLESMAASEGVLCNAGFGTCSEALYMGKKLMVIPMKKQVEQQCNALMLAEMGAWVIKKLNKLYIDELRQWTIEGTGIHVHYPDETRAILQLIIDRHAGKELEPANAFRPLYPFLH